jgi:mediator of RNA polymerase II transcription subunit 17, fungi type
VRFKSLHVYPYPLIAQVTDRDEQPGTRLGENLRRMFSERGSDFFNQDPEQRQANKSASEDHLSSSQSGDVMNNSSDSQNTESMSPEALSNMRLDILPKLQYV